MTLKKPVEGEGEGCLIPSYTDSGENSSSDFDRTQVWTDLNGVITWLKLDGDACAN